MNLLLVIALLSAQPDTLRLDQCYREATLQYPLQQEIGLQSQVADARISALQARFLPQLSLRGDATYNSEVPDFANFPDAFSPPVISNDQYHATLGAEQLIYDGGIINRQKDVVAAEAKQAQHEVEVALYQIRERLNDAYFSVLLLQAEEASLSALHEDIGARLRLVRTQVELGIMLPSNADVLEVELINVEQKQMESRQRRLAALGVLSQFIGRDLGSGTVLALPQRSAASAPIKSSKRPEYALFAARKSSLSNRIGLSARENYPMVSAFGNLSYGRFPGLNMFEDSFTPYYAVGVRMSWKLWDWNANRRERQALRLQQRIVETREATFSKNIDISLERQRRDVERLEELLRRDDEIIALRERIVTQAESQLENGVITATAYLLERNAAYRAELTRDRHRVQLAQAHIKILTTIGEE